MTRSERAQAVILRVVGIFALSAIPAIFFPYSWMDAIHRWLGMGTLPDEPIVSYLARSLSMFYVMIGAIAVLASLDVRYYRGLIQLIAVMSVVFGAVLGWIDFYSGMPALWTISEGPLSIVIGIALLWLQRTGAKR